MERLTPLGFNDRQIPEAIRMVFTVKPVHFCAYVQSTMETVVTTLFNGITGAVAEGLPQQEHHWAILASAERRHLVRYGQAARMHSGI